MKAKATIPLLAPVGELIRRRPMMLGTVALGLVAADAWLLEPRWIKVERVVVALRGLPSVWDGATIVLLSDTHCGPHTSPSWIEHAVSIANSLNPDIILLLGDYVHHSARFIQPGIAPLARLRAREGVFAVLGNHDHWEGASVCVRALKDAQAQVLINRSTTLWREGEPLAIGGVGDLMEDQQRPQAAFQQCPSQAPRILMSHNPDYAEVMSADVRVDLMVSGHTHGGQVHLPALGAPILPSHYGRKYQQGLVRGPHCWVYVSRGVGTISPPVRFLCRPEISLLRLAAA
jgi:uncharacterized protein